MAPLASARSPIRWTAFYGDSAGSLATPVIEAGKAVFSVEFELETPGFCGMA